MKKQRHNVQLRISWLLLVIWICFGLLLVRFAWLQLVDGDELAERAITIAEENRARQSPRGKILDSNGSHIYGEIMWPSQDFPKPHPCVIMLHGYPGSARNDDISHALCRAGCVVLVPHNRTTRPVFCRKERKPILKLC